MDERSNFCCVVCRGSESSNVRDRIVGDPTGVHQVARCSECGLQQMVPPEADLDLYAVDGQVCSVVERFGTSFDTLLRHAWIEASRRADRLVASLGGRAVGSLLDVGGGYGFFASEAAASLPGLRCVVVEPSAQRVSTGSAAVRDRSGHVPEYFVGTLGSSSTAALGRFDVVSLFHVLEHVVDPVELIRNAVSHLAPGGMLLIEVPNADDDLLAASSSFADRWYMMEHVGYFGKDQLADVVRRAVGDTAVLDVVGYQRYGLYNYVSWLEHNAPRGADPDLFEGVDRNWLENLWRTRREEELISDAIYLTCLLAS